MPFIQKVGKMLKNKFFIAFVGICLVMALIYNISFYTNRRKKTRPKIQMVNTVEVAHPPMTNGIDKTGDEVDTNLPESIYKPSKIVDNLKRMTLENRPWGRNPFLTPDEEMSIQITYRKGEGVKEEANIINGILIGQNQRVAIIDHKIVLEGDWIGAEQVVKIDKKKVVLALGKNRRVIVMEETPIAIIVEESERNEI